MRRTLAIVLVALSTTATALGGFTLIRGGTGNKPLDDPGWPTGAAGMFNNAGRIAWWEGPPFGGGQWHSECRGDAEDLSFLLQRFADLDVKTKRVVLHDGEGASFWLNMNHEPEKNAEARIDWVFMVWQPQNWEMLHKMPADLNPTDPHDTSPPSQIDVYTARLIWKDVKVPEGIEVVDNRLQAHGFSQDDGTVVEGKATDIATGNPIAATVKLQKVEPQKTGGYAYPSVAETRTDDQGRWVFRNVPDGSMRVVVESPGHASRVVGYGQFDGQPGWRSFESALAGAAHVAGRVTEGGKPLADVEVSLGNVSPESGGRYEMPGKSETTLTDADGRFRIEGVPRGKAAVWVNKTGYVRPGLGAPVSTPADNVDLTMVKAASAKITIDFQGKNRPDNYIVKIEPEGGEAIGSYGGSASINDQNIATFERIPPGVYRLRGRPNPSADTEETEPITVELKGGETAEITIKAR